MSGINANKKGLEMSFAFIFAMIVGAVILFLAIYMVARLISNSEQTHGGEVSKELSILLNPMQTSLESSKEMSIELPQETRIEDNCYYDGAFGRQTFSTSLKGIGDKWGKPGAAVPITNKYIFSPIDLEGNRLYLFSKPFDFPWKAVDIIIITSKAYCFVSPPKSVEDEIMQIKNQGGLNNLEINYSIEECKNNSIKVCFGFACDISVYSGDEEYRIGYVESQGNKMFYSGSLLYGAIFSDKNLYECNLKRIMKRIYQQGLLLSSESILIANKNCNSNMEADLNLFTTAVAHLNSSVELLQLREIVSILNIKNSNNNCKLW